MRVAVRVANGSEKILIVAALTVCLALGCDSKADATPGRGSDASGSSGGAGSGGSGSGGNTGASPGTDGGGASDGGGGVLEASAEGAVSDAAPLDAGCLDTPCGKCCCNGLAACNAACFKEINCMQQCVLASGQPYNATLDKDCRANCGAGGVLSPAASSLWSCETGKSCRTACLGS